MRSSSPHSHHINGNGPREEVCVVQRGHEVHGARVDDAGRDEEDHVVVGGRGQQVLRHGVALSAIAGRRLYGHLDVDLKLHEFVICRINIE